MGITVATIGRNQLFRMYRLPKDTTLDTTLSLGCIVPRIASCEFDVDSPLSTMACCFIACIIAKARCCEEYQLQVSDTAKIIRNRIESKNV